MFGGHGRRTVMGCAFVCLLFCTLGRLIGNLPGLGIKPLDFVGSYLLWAWGVNVALWAVVFLSVVRLGCLHQMSKVEYGRICNWLHLYLGWRDLSSGCAVKHLYFCFFILFLFFFFWLHYIATEKKLGFVHMEIFELFVKSVACFLGASVIIWKMTVFLWYAQSPWPYGGMLI